MDNTVTNDVTYLYQMDCNIFPCTPFLILLLTLPVTYIANAQTKILDILIPINM